LKLRLQRARADAPECKRLTALTNGSMSQYMQKTSTKRAAKANSKIDASNTIEIAQIATHSVLARVAPVELLKCNQHQLQRNQGIQEIERNKNARE
jgi:hypothetical protein